MNDLESRAGWVCEGVEPDLEAHADVREELIREDSADGEQCQADEDIANAAGRNIEHDHEEGEEQHGAAKVALEDDDDQAHAPHDEHRGEHTQARQRERAHLVRGR